VVVPQVLAADEDEHLGFQEGPLDDQLALTNVLAFGRVNGVELAALVFKDLGPFFFWGLEDVLG
jgi:hypothetical protein